MVSRATLRLRLRLAPTVLAVFCCMLALARTSFVLGETITERRDVLYATADLDQPPPESTVGIANTPASGVNGQIPFRTSSFPTHHSKEILPSDPSETVYEHLRVIAILVFAFLMSILVFGVIGYFCLRRYYPRQAAAAAAVNMSNFTHVFNPSHTLSNDVVEIEMTTMNQQQLAYQKYKQTATVIIALKSQLSRAKHDLQQINLNFEQSELQLADLISESSTLVPSAEFLQLQQQLITFETQRNQKRALITEIKLQLSTNLSTFHELNREQMALLNQTSEHGIIDVGTFGQSSSSHAIAHAVAFPV